MIDSNQDYILRGGRVIDPANGIDEIKDIAVKAGKIANPSELENAKVIDVSGLVIAPGFIDMHVHLRHPGNTDAETIQTGTMAAAAGGFTSIVPMPNTNPTTDSPGAIEYLKRHTELEAVVKVLPCGAMTKGLKGEEMAGIGSLKKAGVIAVSDDGHCIQNHELMRHVVDYSRSFKLPVLDHCEDDVLAFDGVMHEGCWSTLLGMKGISSASEELMISRDIILSRMLDWKIHIQHVSTAESVKMIRYARQEGVAISAEVTPHHLCLTDETIKYYDTNYKMNPPLRSKEHCEALIEGLKDGTITVIATDHAPHTETAKLVEFDYAPFGIIGLETAVPICLTELYHKGILSLSELISKFTVGPAEVLNLESGTLTEGFAADITILNVDIEHKIDKNEFKSKSRNTPFHGYSAKGRAVATIVDGNLVYSLLN
jgi:dihydroorotase